MWGFDGGAVSWLLACSPCGLVVLVVAAHATHATIVTRKLHATRPSLCLSTLLSTTRVTNDQVAKSIGKPRTRGFPVPNSRHRPRAYQISRCNAFFYESPLTSASPGAGTRTPRQRERTGSMTLLGLWHSRISRQEDVYLLCLGAPGVGRGGTGG